MAKLKTIFCQVAEGLIDSQRCVPEDKKCLACPQRKIQRKKSKAGSIKSSSRPAISEVEKIFQEKIFPQLRRWKLFTVKPYRGRVAEDSHLGRIFDPYRITNPPDDFSRIQRDLISRQPNENLKDGEGRNRGRNLWEQRLINCSTQFLRNCEIFETNPRPFPEAKKLRKFLSAADLQINKSYRVLSPWLDKEYCDELVKQIKGEMEKLSSHIKNAISPKAGGKTRPKKWPLVRYMAQLAQLYEMDIEKPAERKNPVYGTTGLFFKFAAICFKNLGFTLTKDQIDFLVRQYRQTRYSLLR